MLKKKKSNRVQAKVDASPPLSDLTFLPEDPCGRTHKTGVLWGVCHVPGAVLSSLHAPRN